MSNYRLDNAVSFVFFSKRKWIALSSLVILNKASVVISHYLLPLSIIHLLNHIHFLWWQKQTKQPKKDCFLISDCHCSFRAICHHLCCISLMKVNLRTKQSRTSMIHAAGPFSASSTPQWLHCRICLQGKDKVRMGFLFPLGKKKL